jgi:xylulokinase
MVGGGLSYDQLCEAAAGVAPGCDGARWTPYLMGERTPHLDPDARAALAGLTASHTRGHLVRAVLEGVTFSLQDSFGIFAEMGVPVTGVRLGGGGARSPLWRQIQADVYGHTAEIVEAEEGAAYGAAILAGVGSGAWPSVDAACNAIVTVASRVRPRPDAVATLRAVYADWQRIYPALKGVGATDPLPVT